MRWLESLRLSPLPLLAYCALMRCIQTWRRVFPFLLVNLVLSPAISILAPHLHSVDLSSFCLRSQIYSLQLRTPISIYETLSTNTNHDLLYHPFPV